MTKSILLVGVGGQGTILASKILTTGLMEAGYDVKMSEIHGMSQRGGSVSSQVRYGDKVYSPVIEKGSADIIVSFEKMEALRNLDYLKKGGKHAQATVLNATAMAEELGNVKAANIILLGTIIKSMGLEDIDWDSILKDNIKPQFLELNLKAIKVGMDAV